MSEMNEMRKIKIAQIGINRYSHAPEIFHTLKIHPELFELVGKKRGLLMSGGIVNHERCADMLLEEFRSAKIGKITLEEPNA